MSENNKIIKDFLKQDLAPNDFVLVPSAYGSGRGFRIAQVLHFSPKMVRVRLSTCPRTGRHDDLSVYPTDLVKLSDEQMVWYNLKK